MHQKPDMRDEVSGNPPNTPVGALGQRVARGFAWMLAKTAGIKVATISMQIILAWLLLPEDFGLVALAYSVTVFVTHLKHGGIREVLIQQQHRYDELAGPATWLSVFIGLGCAALLAVLAPVAALIFREPDLTGLIWVLAVATLITAPVSVPMAKLQNAMRFRAIAIVEIICNVGHAVLAIILAMRGFGAYSFVIPLPIFGALRLVILWHLTRPPVRLNPQWRLWGQLIGAGGLLTVAMLFAAVNQQGANFILGLFHTATVVGMFFFAFNLSMQVHNVLMLNLAHVLLPSFSKLQSEPERQLQAFLRACSVLALVGTPAAMLIAACADPFIRIVFDDRWLPAIPVLQALAFGMALNINSQTSESLIMAQGRYKFFLWVAMARALVFVTLVTIGAVVGGAVAVGVATAIFFILYGPGVMYAAIRPFNRGWRDVAGVHTAPFITSLAAAAIAITGSSLLPEMYGRDVLRLAITTGIFAVIYLPTIRWTAADAWNNLIAQTQTLLQRLRRQTTRDAAAADDTLPSDVIDTRSTILPP